MAQGLDFLQKGLSFQQEEILAYETLWAIKGIKEDRLKELFKKYTPFEALKHVGESDQLGLFPSKKSYEGVKAQVEAFFKESLWEKMSTISVAVNGSAHYPKSLKADYPVGLFYYKGDLALLRERCIAIAGTRKASPEGKAKARQIAKELAEQNFVIVSGLAEGIDTEAQQSAIEAKGATLGVIGTPINKYYPKQNKKLQDKIAKDFLLISQVPFYKYDKEFFRSRTYHFPRRNKIIASISEAVVIVEVSNTRGSYVLANECLKQNKKLFIIDSCFKNKEAEWLKDYEKKGAIKIKDTSDILKHIQSRKSKNHFYS